MPSSGVDIAVRQWLAGDAGLVADVGKVYGERVEKGPKAKFITVRQTGDTGERVYIGSVGGVAELEIVVYTKSEVDAGEIRQAVREKMRKLRGVIGEYHYTVARLTGDTANGADEASGMYTYTLAYDVEYTE